MVRCRRRHRPGCSRSGSEPCEHGDRCCRRWPGRCARPWDLINGRLVRPIDVSLRMSNTYWIVCPKATSALPKIIIFREWLLAEAADDARRLKTLHSYTASTSE